MRNVYAKIQSHRFECCAILFHSLSAATFSTASAKAAIGALMAASALQSRYQSMRSQQAATAPKYLIDNAFLASSQPFRDQHNGTSG
jgi:hypothetical protein